MNPGRFTRKDATTWAPGIVRSMRGVAEEALGAYKDVTSVVEAADRAGLSRLVARLAPLICVKG